MLTKTEVFEVFRGRGPNLHEYPVFPSPGSRWCESMRLLRGKHTSRLRYETNTYPHQQLLVSMKVSWVQDKVKYGVMWVGRLYYVKVLKVGSLTITKEWPVKFRFWASLWHRSRIFGIEFHLFFVFFSAEGILSVLVLKVKKIHIFHWPYVSLLLWGSTEKFSALPNFRQTNC